MPLLAPPRPLSVPFAFTLLALGATGCTALFRSGTGQDDITSCQVTTTPTQNPVCGDGVLESPEQCEHCGQSNAACDDNCQFIDQGNGGTFCSEPQPLFLARAGSTTFVARASGAIEQGASTQRCDNDRGSAAEVFYTVDLPEESLVQLTVMSNDFSAVILHARAENCNGEEFACAGGTGGVTIDFTASGRVLVLVDSDNAFGEFDLELLVTPVAMQQQ